jgi:hypothetical protein
MVPLAPKEDDLTGLTVDKILALAASLRGPEKPPVFLVTGLVTGCWRAEKDGQEYFIIDRATEDQVRRALTTNASRQDGSLPYYQGVEFWENDLLVTVLWLFASKLEDHFFCMAMEPALL